MANERRVAKYRRTLHTIFRRPLTARDALPEQLSRRAEKRLGMALPAAMRDYYLLAGAASENREHNRLFRPEELLVEEGWLLFREENQAVVHWGIPLRSKSRTDPEVWQRVNEDETEWYPEHMAFSVFLLTTAEVRVAVHDQEDPVRSMRAMKHPASVLRMWACTTCGLENTSSTAPSGSEVTFTRSTARPLSS